MKKHHVIAVSIFIVGVFLLFASIWSHIPPKHASASGYAYYRAITVTSTASVASGTLTNFPMLVSSTLSSWEPVADGGHIQNLTTAPNGNQEPADLVFATSSANCGVANLNFETESYVSSTGALVDWVSVPTMATGTVIYACYDSSSVTTDQSHPSSTWDSNYVLVQHEANGILGGAVTSTAGYYTDSTQFKNNATATGTLTTAVTTSSIIGKSVSFTGAAYYLKITPTSSLDLSTGDFSTQGWFQSATSTANVLMALWGQNEVSAQNLAIYVRSNEFQFELYNGATKTVNVTTAPVKGTWYYINASYTSSTQTMSLQVNNGTPVTLSTGHPSKDITDKWYIGFDDNGVNYTDGLVTEVHISNIVRSSQWNLTSYNNQLNPSTFYTVGSETALGGGSGGGATDTWISTGNNNWNTAANWSTGAVPKSTSTAIFSSSSTVNCNINAAASVAGIDITSGYGSGIITQNSGETIAVGTSSWTQSGGVFTGSSAGDAITDNGTFSLTGGTFQSTSGSLTIGASSTISGATFTNNSGTVTFSSTSTTATITGSSTFYNVLFGAGTDYGINNNFTIPTGTVLTIQSSAQLTNDNSVVDLLGGGEIDVQGGIINNSADTEPGIASIPTSTFNLVLNGTGSQSVIGQANGVLNNVGFPLYLPSLTVNKPSGSVNIIGSVSIFGSWTNDDGPSTINAGTSSIIFGGPSSTIIGSSTFYNLYFGNLGDQYDNRLTVTTGTVLVVQSSTNFSPQYSMIYLLGGGEIDAQGNVFLNEVESKVYDGVAYPSSTFNFVLDGTSTQIINDQGISASSSPWYIQGLTIKKPQGVAYLSGVYIQIPGNLTVAQGELQLATGTSAGTLEVDGAVVVSSSAVLSDYPAASSTLKLGTSLTNNGLIFFDGSGEGCTVNLPNYVNINSTTTGQQVPWSGSGNFIMRYVNVQDQTSSVPITILNGTNSGDNGSNWHFTTGPEPELVQGVANSGSAGTTQIALPAFSFKPRASDLIVVPVSAYNQTIAAPTDNASNTYILAASSTFGSYALSLYYAKNITPSSSLIITLNGNGGSSPLLSGSAFEYTGIDPSSTFDRYSANMGSAATSLTSLSTTGQALSELYFGAMTLSASTTASSESGWTTELGQTNNSTEQALYVEDLSTSSVLSTAATWTAATSTNYGAIMAIFHGPFQTGYAANGVLDSAIFDTGVAAGVQLNSFTWQGSAPSNSSVKFQFAVSNSSNGPWNYEGPDGTASTYFSGNAGIPINLVSTTNGSGYTLFNGYRYFRYQVTLFADSTYAYTPTVTQVTINWSP